MNERIERIMASVQKKKVQSFAKKILKKCSFRSKADLDNVIILAAWLYIYGYCEEAMEVCDLLSGIAFTGNYDIWDRADFAACLKARILREMGIEEGREELLRRVREHRHPELYPNMVDYYRNTINVNIESEDSDRPGKVTDFWRINKLIKAVKYREAGGFPIPDEEFEKDIAELVSQLQTVK